MKRSGECVQLAAAAATAFAPKNERSRETRPPLLHCQLTCESPVLEQSRSAAAAAAAAEEREKEVASNGQDNHLGELFS